MGGVRRFKKRPPKRKQEQAGDGRKPYEEIKKENKDFEKYYKAQKIVAEEEWDCFMSAMKRDLPASFRICDCNPGEAEKLLSIVKGDFFSRLISTTEEELKAPKPLPWYPKELGWQLEITRKDIRRSETYFRLHNFLMSETETGSISRQEAVSMIPPLILGVEPHHRVLDMCAAPGSKTAQLIEALHKEGHKVPSGLVVANDIDNSRCYMLVHQAKRLNSPCTIITNHDSSIMPNIIVTNKDGSEGVLKYDRVLCDVPCTGDGTLRKNPDIWPKWNAANGTNLHGVQYRIVKRGVEMLAVDGRAVYSTCSLNPVENEAVIHRLLSEAKGSLELVEVSHLLPGLKFSRGVSTWSPASKDLTLFSKFSEVDEKWHTQVRPSMFPPEDPAEYHLDRCLRILPHHQDTGGFFLAAIVKKAPLPWESEAASRTDEKPAPPPKKKRKPQGYKEDPFVFFAPQEPIWESLKDFYKIDGLDPGHLLTRCTVGKKKNIYFVSEQVRDVLAKNQDTIKIINCGVKVFARCDNKSMECSFRLAQEGLERVQLFFKPDRRIRVERADLETLLQNADPSSPVEGALLNPDVQKQMDKISQGSCILDYQDDLKLTLVGWRGRQTLRPYVSIADAVHFLHLIGGDSSKYMVNKFKKNELEAKSEGNSEVGAEVTPMQVDNPSRKESDSDSGSRKGSETESECRKESEMDSEATC